LGGEVSALKKIGDFTAPKDEATGAELRRQLRAFQGNVDDMGDTLKKSAMAKLERNGPGIVRDDSCVLYPGQFQLFDTSVTNVSAGLAKPTSAGAGTFIVAINLPGSTSNLYLRAEAGCLIDGTDHVTIVTAGNALVFCDGENYWSFV
jgi:hypothetical protein